MPFIYISFQYLVIQLLGLVNLQALMHFIAPGFTNDYLLPVSFVIMTLARFITKDFRMKFMAIFGFILGVFVAYFNPSDQVPMALLMLRYGITTGVSLVISHAGARIIEEYDFQKYILGPIPFAPPLMSIIWQIGFLWIFSDFISVQKSPLTIFILVMILPTIIGAIIFLATRYGGVFFGTLIFGKRFMHSPGLYLSSKVFLATLFVFGLTQWLKPEENIFLLTLVLGFSFITEDFFKIITKRLIGK